MGIVLASVISARDVSLSAARALLLTAEVGGTFAVVLLCNGRPNLARVLARGAAACLILFALFDVVEALWWIGLAGETMRFGPMLVHFGALQNVGPLPRLAGPVTDGNRAGFVLLFFGLLIAAGEPRPMLRRTALSLVTLFLLLTISRSAWLGAAAMLAAIVIRRRGRVPLGLTIATSIVVAAAVVILLVNPAAAHKAVSVITSPVTQRFSTSEGSAQSHLALIERGIADATESVPSALIGLGYGNSHLVLQDVFPGNKYGNFHSLYVSMFAESGVVALILTVILLFTPLVGGGPWRPLDRWRGRVQRLLPDTDRAGVLVLTRRRLDDHAVAQQSGRSRHRMRQLERPVQVKHRLDCGAVGQCQPIDEP